MTPQPSLTSPKDIVWDTYFFSLYPRNSLAGYVLNRRRNTILALIVPYIILLLLGGLFYWLMVSNNFTYFSRTTGYDRLRGHLFWIWGAYTVFLLIFVVMVYLYHRWVPQVQHLFTAIYLHHLEDVSADTYRAFLDRYRQTLDERRSPRLIRWLLIAFIILIMGQFLFGNGIFGLPAMENRIDAPLAVKVLGLSFGITIYWGVLGFWIYCVGAAGWAIYTTGRFVYRLGREFKLIIYPGHPDQCAGLKEVGDFCMNMILPILIGTIFLGMMGIGGIVYFDVIDRTLNEFFRVSMSGLFTMAANLLLIFFATPLWIVSFLRPMWGFHDQMVRVRWEYEDFYATELTHILNGIQQHVRANQDAGSGLSELEKWQKLHPNIIGFPRWPFNARVWRSITLTQVIPIASLLITNDFVKNVLAKLSGTG